MTLQLESAAVTDALAAVAAVDGTPPDMLATMIVEDWLREHRHRFMLAAEALARLDGDPHPDVETSGEVGVPPSPASPEPDLPDDGVTSPGDDTPEAGKEGGAPTGEGQSGTSGPASPGAPPAHRCTVDGCSFVGKSGQALGGHKATAHRKKKAAAEPPATVDQLHTDTGEIPPPPLTVVTCDICNMRTPNVRRIKGLGHVCPDCARDAA